MLLMQNLGKNVDSSSPDLPLQQDHEFRAQIDSHQNKVTKKEGVRADCSESTKPAMESYVSKVRGNTNTSVPLDEIPNPTIRGDKTISAISKSTVLEEVEYYKYILIEKEQNKYAIAVAAATSAWMRSYYSESEKEHNKHAIAMASATAAAANAAVAEAQAAVTVVRLTSYGRGTMFNGGRERWAAVRIQAVFRGYLVSVTIPHLVFFLGKKSVESFKGISEVARRYSPTCSDPSIFYNSTSYWDEYLWGGAWMYYATGNSSYLALVTTPGLTKHAGAFWGGPDFGVLSWDNKLTGAQELLTDIAAEICLSQIHELVEQPNAEFQVWCDNGYPKLVQGPLEIALTGKMTRRCACFTKEELNQPGLEVYNGCDHLAKVYPV
ncbi:hypothetical protein GIB67_036905 [Kingdonia uniflora]|uniref:cellulase n=1 Tax=Kingdonia uniflora TaxID=39325 RepID=A0A7J7NVL8_9MAGN|nr:hypothetical protein GIB67_036905 [Kingdonia uniflora]